MATYMCRHIRTYLGQVAEYSKSSFGLLQGDSVPVRRGNVREKNWKSLAGGHHFTALLRHTSVELCNGEGREVTDMGQFYLTAVPHTGKKAAMEHNRAPTMHTVETSL